MKKRRSRYEVFAQRNLTKTTYHRKIKNARKSKKDMQKKGGKAVIIYDIKKDKIVR